MGNSLRKMPMGGCSELKSNPFLSEDDISGILMKQIEHDLDEDMCEYCDADITMSHEERQGFKPSAAVETIRKV